MTGAPFFRSFPNNNIRHPGYDNFKEGVEMKKYIVCLLSFTVLLLAGCERLLAPSGAPKSRIVSYVEISIDNGTERHQVLYKDPRKITKVLNYLRCMETWNFAELDPLPQEAPRYSIDLHLSDGTSENPAETQNPHFVPSAPAVFVQL